MLCGRLGFWQLSRLSERRAYNAVLLSRLGQPRLTATGFPGDTAEGHYRRGTASGVLQYELEIAWAPRARQGSPGVNFLTPLKVAGSDTMLLVDRGWAYSPDAKSVDFARWRERDTTTVSGYLETWSQPCSSDATASLPPDCAERDARVLRRLNRKAVERLVGAPVAPYLLMQTSDSVLRADSVPVRVEIPELDEGPHLGYAYQWFAFATIALAGGIALARRKPSR